MATLVADILSGNKITPSSMQYLRRAVLKDKHGRMDGESTAATALRMIRNKDGARYSYMSASKEECSDRITLFKYNGKLGSDRSTYPYNLTDSHSCMLRHCVQEEKEGKGNDSD